MSRNLGKPLAAWPAVARAAFGPALASAAAALAAEIASRLSAQTTSDPDVVVTMGQEDGQATVTVSLPGAAVREYGTRATPARPFLRPAAAAVRDDMGRRVSTALRSALRGEHLR